MNTSPTTPDIAATIAEVWARLLDLDEVPTEANFFELGGRSGEFVRAALEIEDRYGIELSLRDFFDAPTVAALTDRVVTELSRSRA